VPDAFPIQVDDEVFLHLARFAGGATVAELPEHVPKVFRSLCRFRKF
jgi:hypothetical protein